jgi:3-phenylpropionate/cinnamic acid dioxygenase small subunit
VTTSTQSTQADMQTSWEIAQFLYVEAELLDNWRYDEWIDLVTEDFNYAVPVPVTRDDPTRPMYDEGAFLVEETKPSLDLWVQRSDPEVFEWAWGENPRQRVRHFLSNIRVRTNDADVDEVTVRANLMLSFGRQSDPAIFASAERHDRLRRVDGRWLLAGRRVYLDQNVHALTHLRLIF